MTTRMLRSAPATALLLAMAFAMPALAGGGGARVATATLRATPIGTTLYGPGMISGRATLTTNAGTDTTSVVVRVEGLQPGTSHIGHIHYGDDTEPCTRLQPGAIIADLGPLTANARGTAVARTVIDIPSAGVADCAWWVAVHEGPENVSPQTPAIAIGSVDFVDPGHDD